MNLGKYLSTLLAVMLSIFLTYHSVMMINGVETSTTMQVIEKAFTIFSIIYTCGKLTPLIIEKATLVIISVVKLMSKNQSNSKPFN